MPPGASPEFVEPFDSHVVLIASRSICQLLICKFAIFPAPTRERSPMPLPSVLVLGGGPDAEREVSIKSSTAITKALNASGQFDARLEIIDRIDAAWLKSQPADLIFPYLHGPWGEGGPLQDILELDGRPFVGTDARGSRAAMDKVASKVFAMDAGMQTAPMWILSTRDTVCPSRLPVVIKPVHEGSTIGLHVCTSRAEYAAAVGLIAKEHAERIAQGLDPRAYMIEPMIRGYSGRPARELTVGIINNEALPVIEIKPKDGLYDYDAKYVRDDTQYLVEGVDLELAEPVVKKIKKMTVRLFRQMGLRHIARADFLLDEDGTPWFLEINTTPGFTDHSLVPKAARQMGLEMPALCAKLAEMALTDAAPKPARPPAVLATAHEFEGEG